MTILNECLGLALETYFVLNFIQKRGVSGEKYLMQVLKANLKYSKILGVPFSKLINEAIDDPFLSFQKVTQASFNVYKETYSQMKSLDRGVINFRSWTHILEKMDESAYFVFAIPYPLFYPIQYLLTYCGPESSLRDREQVAECLDILRSSKSLPEFLKRIKSKPGPVMRKRVIEVDIKTGGRLPVTKTPPKRLKQNLKENIRLTKKVIIDRDHLKKDRLVYNFFIEHICGRGLIVNFPRIELIRLNFSVLTASNWNSKKPLLLFDVRGKKVSSTQVIRTSVASYLQNLIAYEKGSPLVTTFIETYCNQLISYLKNVGAFGQKEAFAIFKDDFCQEIRLRAVVLEQCKKMIKGRSANIEALYQKLKSHKRWCGDILGPQLSSEVFQVVVTCGFESTERDKAVMSKGMRLLKQCDSMTEFVFGLSKLTTKTASFSRRGKSRYLRAA